MTLDPTQLPDDAPHSAIAVYPTEQAAEEAVRTLQRGGFDMTKLSILARGVSLERHIIGVDTRADRVRRWAGFGGAWGAIFGALIFVPGIGHVAVGGYLLWVVAEAAVGAGGGALVAALTNTGVSHEGALRYEADLKADKYLLIAHGSAADVAVAEQMLGTTGAERVDLHRPESSSAAAVAAD